MQKTAYPNASRGVQTRLFFLGNIAEKLTNFTILLFYYILKSFQLVYIETLQRVEETSRCGELSLSKELTLQAKGMAKILKIFQDGVVLLDEGTAIL